MSRLPERLPEQPGPGERLYRALLLLYPRRFRSDFGPAMIDLFHVRRWQYLSEGGSFVALRFWTFVLRDLVGTALPERFGPLAARLFGSGEGEGEGAPRALATKTRGLGMESMWGDVRYAIRRLVRTPGFSALAILIVALGIGVNSAMFSVLNAALFRPLPVGIRMALGAGRSQVIGMVLSEVMSVVGVGAVIGLGLAWAATRGLGGLLYGVSTTDPVTFVGVVVVLGAVAFLATLVPARRAARANPVTALRYD